MGQLDVRVLYLCQSTSTSPLTYPNKVFTILLLILGILEIPLPEIHIR